VGRKDISAAGSAVVYQAVAEYMTIDDAAARRIISDCRSNDPTATEEEIAHLAQVAAAISSAPEERG
jgi:hypothetical protein